MGARDAAAERLRVGARRALHDCFPPSARVIVPTRLSPLTRPSKARSFGSRSHWGGSEKRIVPFSQRTFAMGRALPELPEMEGLASPAASDDTPRPPTLAVRPPFEAGLVPAR